MTAHCKMKWYKGSIGQISMLVLLLWKELKRFGFKNDNYLQSQSSEWTIYKDMEMDTSPMGIDHVIYSTDISLLWFYLLYHHCKLNNLQNSHILPIFCSPYWIFLCHFHSSHDFKVINEFLNHENGVLYVSHNNIVLD